MDGIDGQGAGASAGDHRQLGAGGGARGAGMRRREALPDLVAMVAVGDGGRPGRQRLLVGGDAARFGDAEQQVVIAGVVAVVDQRPQGRLARLPRAFAILAGASVLAGTADRKSTRLNSSHQIISYAVFCLKKKKYIATNCHYLP